MLFLLRSKKIRLFILCFVLLCSAAFGQRNSYEINVSDVYVKQGKNYLKKQINKIEPWGILVNYEEAINYSNILQIQTDNKLVVDEIALYVENMVEAFSESSYLIDLSNAKLKYRSRPSPKKAMKEFSFYASVLSNRVETFETGIFVIPEFLPENFYLKINATVDLLSNIKDYKVSGAFLGAGYTQAFRQFHIMFGLNFGEKIIRYPDYWISDEFNSGKTYMQLFYTEVILKQNLFANHFFIMAGAKYYFDNVRIKGETDRFSFSVGGGVSF